MACGAERVSAQVQGEHEVGLLDHLLAVEVDVGEVQQQRVLLGRGVLEVPRLVLGEALGLGVDAQLLVEGDQHRLRGVAPGGRLLRVDAELGGPVGVAFDGVGGQAQVSLRHQVGVDVVVGDGAVLVGAGDAVDAKAPAGVVVAQRAPQPRGLDEQLEPGLALERMVVGRGLVAADGIGDVRADVEGGRSRRPVSRALPSVDRPPGKRRALEPQELGPVARQAQGRVAPAQRVAGGVRRGVGQDGQDERLGVPEGVSVIAGAGQALGGDRAPLAPGARLQGVKEREAHRLLELGVAFELDVGALPEVVQVFALGGEQPLPAGVARLGQRRGDLVAQRRRRAPARPPVGQELDHPQPLARLHVGRDRHAPEVLAALGRRLGPGRASDE